MKWFRKRSEKPPTPQWMDRCPDIPHDSIVVKPLNNGRFGLFRKELCVSCEYVGLSCAYDLKQLTDDTFATVKQAQVRWRHMLKAPVIIWSPGKGESK